MQNHDVRLVRSLSSCLLHTLTHSPAKYMLWTDAGSREFIAAHYPWFLNTFDNYRYPIQRADAIRYFVLYHYGGIYMDLDIGCRRSVDPLLVYPVILPKTIPVGISNDLMFAEKGHPFFKLVIDNLSSFDYFWLINYPTVMFSTGPMFLSIQYGLYVRKHFDVPVSQIRVLPKSLYGKNINPSEAPHSFFSHFYASSWHDDDAPFIAFLSSWGKLMMWLCLIILIIGLLRLFAKPRRSITRIAGYDILLPRLSQSGRGRHFHIGRYSFVLSFSQQSPDSSPSSSPTEDIPVLHIPLDHTGRPSSYIMGTFHQVRNRIRVVGERFSPPSSPISPNQPRQSNRGVLFFLPASFATHSPDIELDRPRPASTSVLHWSRSSPQTEKDVESGVMQSSDNGLDWDNIDEPQTPSHSRSSSEETAVDDGLSRTGILRNITDLMLQCKYTFFLDHLIHVLPSDNNYN
jgi:hypothetical protein